MSAPQQKKIEPLKWNKVLPSPLHARYKLITGQEYVMEGVKTLCDSGHAELAYNVVEMLLGRGMPLLPGHVDFIPESCSLFNAKEVLGYEDSGYIFAVYGYSGRSEDSEFSCLFIDDVNIYARVCTLREVQQIWELFMSMREESK